MPFMEYVLKINSDLKPPKKFKYKAIDLFAGCGGLSLGFEASGIETIGYEMDESCCETYRKNLKGACHCCRLEPGMKYPYARVVVGGPPCQPFSVGGKQLGLADSRDGFPVFIDAVESLDPDIWIFENVRGLLYRNKTYFDEILHRLKSLNYIVDYKLLNAVKHGVPQNRERLIVVGHRGNFNFPVELGEKTTVGEALGDMAFQFSEDSKFLTKSMDKYVAKYEKASKCVNPRDLYLDRPARTLTCRNLAGATGDMHRVRLPDGRRRRIEVREAARLQSFPDWFEFQGKETNQYNQVGNAVPPLLAYELGKSVVQYLESKVRYSSSEILYRNLPDQMELFVMEKDEVKIPEFITKSKKSKRVQVVINEALYLLNNLGIPFDGLTERRLEKMAMAFLAVVDVKMSADWEDAKALDGSRALSTRQIIEYINKHFEENISSGSYDDIRRKDLKLPVLAEIVVRSANDPNAATNNPTRGYALNPEYALLVRAFKTEGWEDDVEEFVAEKGSLADRLSVIREIEIIDVTIPTGQTLEFSPGEHNLLQKAIIEEFLPRYGYGAEVLYVGDTANKMLLCEKEKLSGLNFFELGHDELPDVVAYCESRNWLYLIEAVHSSGPINSVRLEQLKRLTCECSAELVFVTAFLERSKFRQFAPEIAWETEVWIADAPDHMIHFNGDKFMGPYAKGRRE